MGTGASIPTSEADALKAGYTQDQIEEYKHESTKDSSAAPAEAAVKADFDEWADSFNKAGELHMTRIEETKRLFDSRAVNGTWTLEPFADLVRLGQPELTDDEVEEVFKAVDTDSDGKLSFDDFWKHFFDIKAAVKSTAKKKKKLIQADIYVRFRPFSEGGGHSKDAEGGNRRIQLADFDTKGVFIKEAKGKVRYKYMRKVVLPETSQEEMYRIVAAQYDEAVTNQQHNVLLLAYGQTGTGKTHTMLGPRESLKSDTEHPDWGIFPRFISCVLKRMKSMEDSPEIGTNCILTASAIEFCNIMCYDLLDKHTTVIIDKTTGEPVSAKQIEITKVSQLADFMDTVNSNRTMAKTGMNEVSSRSHAALILTLHQYCRKDVSSKEYANMYNKTTFTLMDLAGAERVSKTGGKFVGGLQIFMEIAEANRKGKTPPMGATGALINFELTEMNTAVSKATMKWKQGMKYKVPKGMTTDFIRFVSSCMEGRTRLAMIICCSQSPSNGGETWFSLNMGKGMAKLCAPLAKQPAKDISWFEKKGKKQLSTVEKKLKKTPKDHMYYSLRMAELAAATANMDLLAKIQTMYEAKAATAVKPDAAAPADGGTETAVMDKE